MQSLNRANACATSNSSVQPDSISVLPSVTSLPHQLHFQSQSASQHHQARFYWGVSILWWSHASRQYECWYFLGLCVGAYVKRFALVHFMDWWSYIFLVLHFCRQEHKAQWFLAKPKRFLQYLCIGNILWNDFFGWLIRSGNKITLGNNVFKHPFWIRALFLCYPSIIVERAGFQTVHIYITYAI